MTNPTPSDKSRGIALALGVPLGIFGAHRFYAGKTGTGLLMLCTIGGAGLWWLYDMIMIIGGQFEDADGRRLIKWDPDEQVFPAMDVREELDALRREVAELHERVDFAERLLAQPKQPTE